MSRDVTFEETKAWPWDCSEGGEKQSGWFTVEDCDAHDERESQNNTDDSDQNATRNRTPSSNNNSQTGENSANTSTDSNTSNLQTPIRMLNQDDYDDSVELRRVRNLAEIYDETEEMHLD